MSEKYENKGNVSDTVGYAKEQLNALVMISAQLDELLKLQRPKEKAPKAAKEAKVTGKRK